jgi:Ca-activated chloride channel family protein
LAALCYGTWHNNEFWRSATQRGDRLMAQQQYREAAAAYNDPWRIGTAQYRDGDFEAAARTFARVPGAVGAFNQGNAWLMHGDYAAAVASYDRALALRPDWHDAQDNRDLARLRQLRLADAADSDQQESTEDDNPDDEVVDEKGDTRKTDRQQLNDAQLTDEELRATWLRRVRTTPGEFLRAKFAYQAAQANNTPAEADANAGDAP